MTQANQVSLAGTAESVRHINLSAAKGSTMVSRSAEEYKVWGGTGGHGTLASTTNGDTIEDEKETNFVDISGSATAGIHNKLDITISGQTSTTNPIYNEDNTAIVSGGTVDYDGIDVAIEEGSEWFSKDDLQFDDVTVVNGSMADIRR